MPQKYSMSATGGPPRLIGLREADRVPKPAKRPQAGAYRCAGGGAYLAPIGSQVADWISFFLVRQLQTCCYKSSFFL